LVLGLVFLIISTITGAVFLAFGIIGVLIIINERKAEILDNWSALISSVERKAKEIK
jgi:hypothetical protein